MIQDKQKLKNEKQQQREETREKHYLNALKKIYRAARLYRTARIKLVENYWKKWRVILK